MSVAPKLLTAEGFARLPEPREGGKMELVHGKVVTMVPGGGEHGHLAGDLHAAIRAFVRPRGLGLVAPEVGYLLSRDPDLVRAPDVSFTRADLLPGGRLPRAYVDHAPTLVIEVTSPGDTDADVNKKVREYLAAGTERVWVVRPETQTVTVHRPGNTSRTFAVGATLTSDDAGFTVEGFALPLADLFGD
jgi:Uma2 family endonuclease